MGRLIQSFLVALFVISAPLSAWGLDFDKAIAQQDSQARNIASTLGRDKVQNKGDKVQQKQASKSKAMKVTLIRVKH